MERNSSELTVNIRVVDEAPYFELVVEADGNQARRLLTENSRLELDGCHIPCVRHGNDCVQFVVVERGFVLPKFQLRVLIADQFVRPRFDGGQPFTVRWKGGPQDFRIAHYLVPFVR